MGLLEQVEDAEPSDLNQRLNLQVSDPEFYEYEQSIFSRKEIKNMPAALVEVYQRLDWVPTKTHLLLNEEYNTYLDFDSSNQVLEFNKGLSSLLGVII